MKRPHLWCEIDWRWPGPLFLWRFKHKLSASWLSLKVLYLPSLKIVNYSIFAPGADPSLNFDHNEAQLNWYYTNIITICAYYLSKKIIMWHFIKIFAKQYFIYSHYFVFMIKRSSFCNNLLVLRFQKNCTNSSKEQLGATSKSLSVCAVDDCLSF